MCTLEVQLSTRNSQFGKTSECAQKMSNSPHGKGNLARLSNVHTSGPTLNTGQEVRQDFRICTQDVQLSTRGRQFGKTSECTHKRSISLHGIGIWQDFRICTQEVQLSTRESQFGKTSEYAHKRCNSTRDR
ncbi:hypothetical protein PoB_004572900 [Plakobranchus ocellatus]|uniref:Uncharacterized protein n=1 Tax=Plakobranchus ocellatus TaxID=259542 RepID=A0AAV4BJX8_9GAST|nr:hypothetical protein PoB_004572900 [Plakobranchus ocellatus]